MFATRWGREMIGERGFDLSASRSPHQGDGWVTARAEPPQAMFTSAVPGEPRFGEALADGKDDDPRERREGGLGGEAPVAGNTSRSAWAFAGASAQVSRSPRQSVGRRASRSLDPPARAEPRRGLASGHDPVLAPPAGVSRHAAAPAIESVAGGVTELMRRQLDRARGWRPPTWPGNRRLQSARSPGATTRQTLWPLASPACWIPRGTGVCRSL